jgi:hypothetical protein
LKIKIAALLALCVFLSGIAGINSASATDSTTFTNVDLKNFNYGKIRLNSVLIK